MSFIKTKSGITWHCDLRGKGACLLFIHGWAADLRTWGQQIEYFSKNYQVLAVHLPGHGKTNWIKISLSGMAKDIDEILVKQGINEINLIASSFGGLVALAYLKLFPQKVKRLVFASSSSVYGANTKMPFSIHDNVDHPISLYAATKKSNELLAHSYAHLYQLPCTGLRYFTVYGPWGRPDMALFLFTKAILEGKPIEIFNHGKMKRDFTFIDDIVEGVVRIAAKIPQPNPSWSGDCPDPGTSNAPYRIYNIGNNQPVDLLEFVGTLETLIGKKAEKKFLPLQAGDVPTTFADVVDLMKDVGYKPQTPFSEGMKKFVDWYREYYSI